MNISAKKSLGQNFLVDDTVVYRIVDKLNEFCFEKQKDMHVLEIGPGTGVLTEPLLTAGYQVTAIEKDPRALQHLTEHLLPKFPNQLQLISGDILKFDLKNHAEQNNWTPQNIAVMGNIPYYITSDILLWASGYRALWSHSIFMMQKEVAERLVSPAKTKQYSRLSVKMQLLFEMENFLAVPAKAFQPRPKVDSAVVAFQPYSENPFHSSEEEKKFESFCARLFSARRKMLRKILETELQNLDRETFFEKLESISLDETTRPDAASPTQILNLFRLISA